MENGTGVLHTSTMNGAGVAADNVNRLPVPMETSSHVSALSFVSGPTLTAGSVSSVALQATPATYIPVQVVLSALSLLNFLAPFTFRSCSPLLLCCNKHSGPNESFSGPWCH